MRWWSDSFPTFKFKINGIYGVGMYNNKAKVGATRMEKFIIPRYWLAECKIIHFSIQDHGCYLSYCMHDIPKAKLRLQSCCCYQEGAVYKCGGMTWFFTVQILKSMAYTGWECVIVTAKSGAKGWIKFVQPKYGWRNTELFISLIGSWLLSELLRARLSRNQG